MEQGRGAMGRFQVDRNIRQHLKELGAKKTWGIYEKAMYEGMLWEWQSHGGDPAAFPSWDEVHRAWQTTPGWNAFIKNRGLG